MMSMDKVVAWGECGLDYFDKKTRGQVSIVYSSVIWAVNCPFKDLGRVFNSKHRISICSTPLCNGRNGKTCTRLQLFNIFQWAIQVKDERTRTLQREVFARQIDLAVSLKKPLVVHTRFAEDDTLELLEKHLPDSHPVHVHCFTSSNTLAQSLLERFPSLRLGFTGVITFKNAPDVQDVVRNTPLDRILLETDSPYMAPEPFRGRIAHPGHVSYVADAVAKLKGVSRAEVLAACRKNTRQIYGIWETDMLNQWARMRTTTVALKQGGYSWWMVFENALVTTGGSISWLLMFVESSSVCTLPKRAFKLVVESRLHGRAQKSFDSKSQAF